MILAVQLWIRAKQSKQVQLVKKHDASMQKIVINLVIDCLAADLYQALDSAGYELAIRAELGCGNWSFEAEVMQQDLALPVD